MHSLPLLAFPIPAPPGTPPWVNVLFGLAAIASVVVVVLLAVRNWPRDGGGGGDPR